MKASVLKNSIFFLTLLFALSVSNTSFSSAPISKSEKNSPEEIVKLVISSQLAAFKEKDVVGISWHILKAIKLNFNFPKKESLTLGQGLGRWARAEVPHR